MRKINMLFLTGTIALFVAGCSKNGLKNEMGSLSIINNINTSLASAPGDVVGKVTVGYQGWFLASGDGSSFNSWQHTNLECWPDTREYATTYNNVQFDQAGTLQPPFTGTLGNGQPAVMFSDWDQSTVNTHFLWMQQNGIDCAALQRFGSHFSDPRVLSQANGVADRVQNAAQTYGRKFYVMYDISGWTNFQTEIKTDWTNTTKAHTTSSAYAKQNGKPVVCIWGIGFSSRPGTVSSWSDVINWFKSQGCYVIVGAPNNFSTDAANQPAYNTANMLMPWRVGSTSNFQTNDTNDLNYCNAHNIDYQTDIYPGTAFYNSNGGTTPKNQIPRMHGDFMWSQFAGAKNAGVSSVYISMFDEMNEATAILKCAEDASMIPAGKYFLTLDADGTHVSSDFYLRLTNDGGKMIKGQIPYTATEPTPFVVSTPIADGTYKIINRNDGLALDAQGNLSANGTPIEQYTYHSGANQQWIVTNIGSGQYKIIGVASSRALDVTGNLTADGSAVELYDYHSGTGQTWNITPTSGGYYTIKGVNSGKLVEVAGNSTAPGALIDIFTDHAGNNQQWAFQAP